MSIVAPVVRIPWDTVWKEFADRYGPEAMLQLAGVGSADDLSRADQATRVCALHVLLYPEPLARLEQHYPREVWTYREWQDETRLWLFPDRSIWRQQANRHHLFATPTAHLRWLRQETPVSSRQRWEATDPDIALLLSQGEDLWTVVISPQRLCPPVLADRGRIYLDQGDAHRRRKRLVPKIRKARTVNPKALKSLKAVRAAEPRIQALLAAANQAPLLFEPVIPRAKRPACQQWKKFYVALPPLVAAHVQFLADKYHRPCSQVIVEALEKGLESTA